MGERGEVLSMDWRRALKGRILVKLERRLEVRDVVSGVH